MAFDAFALILLMLLLGLAFQRLGVFAESAPETLNKVVLYVCLPAAVLRYAPQLELTPAVLGIAAVPWLMLLPTLAIVAVLGRFTALRRDERAVLLLGIALGNTSFLGFPLISALLGEAALPYAVIYDQFGSFMVVTTYGLYVLARYSGESAPTAADIGRRILRFPPFLALVVALTAMPATPPGWIDGLLQRLADALLPLAVLAVGLSIRLKLPREELLPLAVGLAGKLIVLPACALVAARLLGLRDLAADAVVLEAAMPTMITAAVLAIAQGLAPRLAAALVGYGILLSLLTLPAWRWLLVEVLA